MIDYAILMMIEEGKVRIQIQFRSSNFDHTQRKKEVKKSLWRDTEKVQNAHQ